MMSHLWPVLVMASSRRCCVTMTVHPPLFQSAEHSSNFHTLTSHTTLDTIHHYMMSSRSIYIYLPFTQQQK